MKLSQITTKNILSFLEGNYQYYKSKIVDRPNHLKEQTYWRLYECKNTCLLNGVCKNCSCPVIKKAFASTSCNPFLFPDLMPGREWEVYKRENNIKNIKEIIETIENELHKEEYNSEPVFYCTNCLNIAIKELTKVKDLYVCLDCGNIHNEEASFNDWNELYIKEYGQSFLSKEKEPVE